MRSLPTLALVLLLASLVPGPVLSQGLSDTDLSVTNVTPGQPAVGAERPIGATVRNGGPSTAVGVTVTFYWQTNSTPIAGQGGQSSVTYGQPLLPGASVTLQLAWKPRTDQAGAGMVIAVASTGQNNVDPDRSNNQAQASTFVVRPDVLLAPSWNENLIRIDAGAEHPLPLKITNGGNVEATFVPVVSPPDDSDWTWRVSPTEVKLLPGAKADVVLTAQPPADAPAGDRVDKAAGLAIAVEMRGYEDAERGVARPVIPSLVVSERRALQLNATEPEPRRPGVAITGTITVLNEGNTDETVTLSRATSEGDAPAWWPVTFGTKRLGLAAGQSKSTTFQVDLPPNATAGQAHLVVVANGTGGAVPPVVTTDIALEVIHVHDLSLQAPKRELSLRAAQAGTFDLEVANLGNGPDQVTLTASSPGEGWMLEMQPTSTTLQQASNKTMKLKVTPPPGLAAVEDIALTARVSTGNGTERVQRSVELTVDVLRGANIDVRGASSVHQVDPETGRTVLLTLVNGGNIQGNATVTLGSPDGWQVSANRRDVSLARLDTLPLRLTVLPPQGAQTGETAEVLVKVANEGNGPSYEHVVDLVVGGPDLAVELDQTPARVPSGQLVDITVRVLSQGLRDAGASKLTLVAQGDRGTVTLARWDVPALAVRDVFERTTTWNTTEWKGNVLLTARADEGAVLTEEDESNNERARVVFVSTLAVDIVTPPATTVDPGQVVAFTTPPLTVRVTNRGNDQTSLSVTIKDEAGWTDHTAKVRVAPGETTNVPLQVKVPRPTGRLVNNFTVTASADDRPNSPVAFGRWTVSVRDIAAPRFVDLNLTGTPQWGVEATHRVLWDDGTGLAGGTVHIEGPNGTIEELDLSTSGANAMFTWVPRAVGEHRVTVELQDLAGNRATSRSISVTTIAPAPPSVGSLPSGAVAPGTDVPLEITAVAPLREVAITTGGIRSVLPVPYHVNTSGWTEATHRIEVVATDTLGQTGQGTVMVRIDATPPGLRAVDVEPEGPSDGDDVVVRMTFDEAVSEAAVVLVLSSGERILEVAEPVSDTVWAASFVMPKAKLERADVQATDVAGNAVVHEAAVDLSSSRFLPLPGWVAVLALLAGAALVRRWPRRPEV